MMPAYKRRTEFVSAQQWDGSKESAYQLIGYVFSNGARAAIEDGYPSQGPDVIMVETVEGMRRMYTGVWLLKESHGRFRLMENDAFVEQFEPYDPDPDQPEILTVDSDGSMPLTPRMIEHLQAKPGDWLRLEVREDGSMLLGPVATQSEVAQWQMKESTDEQSPPAAEEGVRG